MGAHCGQSRLRWGEVGRGRSCVTFSIGVSSVMGWRVSRREVM